MQIHPQTVHFPIAFIVGAFVSLVIYLLRKDIFYRRMGFVLHAAGSVSMLIAIITGRIVENQVNSAPLASEVLQWHEVSAYISILLSVLFWIWMYLRLHKMEQKELILFIIIYGLCLSTMIYTAYLGGVLVYTYGVGTS